jgi:hypothetical protein
LYYVGAKAESDALRGGDSALRHSQGVGREKGRHAQPILLLLAAAFSAEATRRVIDIIGKFPILPDIVIGFGV